MRNLKNVAQSRGFTFSSFPLTIFTWDALENELICAFSSPEAEVVDFQRIAPNESEGRQIALLPARAGDRIVSLQYLADSNSICAIFEKGDIVIIREDPLPGEQPVEIVGTIDEGILAAEWSPDEDMVLVCTKVSTALFMTRDFDPLASVELRPEDKLASKHVSVGWGKAETQFQGKRAKALRDPTIPETVDQGLLSPEDDGRVTISWRGDGAFVAVNAIEKDRGRMIRVYSREGTLDSVSEPVDHLEGALSWRPAGNLIAGLQRMSNAATVVFFERNGLRHGEFPLRLSSQDLASWGKVISLHWNIDSTVLAVRFVDRIQLWTMGNYHYYLKQEILIDWTEDTLSAPVLLKWHPERPLTLATAPSGAIDDLVPVTFREFAFSIASGSTDPSSSRGSVAVIDGKTIKYTPLRLANVPPPMALHEIEVPDHISDLSISPDDSSIAVLLRDSVVTYAWNSEKRPYTIPLEKTRSDLPYDQWESRQVLMLEGDQALALLQSRESTQVNRVFDCSNGCFISVEGPSGPLTSICSLFLGIGTNDLFLQTDDGAVYSAPATLSDGLLDAAKVCAFPSKASWTGAVKVSADHLYVFGLLNDGSLYANGVRLVSNCNSFSLTASYLLFTDTRHFLRFVHLPKTGGPLVVPDDNSEYDERCRSIERGAKLVTVIPSAFSVVLQMPRGNLETIYPRALVLSGIRRCVDEKDYLGAMMACRAQRVDMNILHDYNPSQFLSCVDLFIQQINNETYLDLFLSQLKEEDVTTTLYKDTLRALDMSSESVTKTETSAGEKESFKVNRICQAILAVLQKDQKKNLQNIVSAYVCMTPPNLEAGLSIVANLQGSDVDLAERAAEHICFLADPNRLYEAALGMYNMRLAILIAQQSQRDPREYLPFLQKLEEMPELRRKFTVDDYLQRYEKAVTHLFGLNKFEEVTAYVSEHCLYAIALEHYKYQQEKLGVIVRLHSDYLASIHQYKAAGIGYESLGDYTMAYKMYKETDHWKETLSTASLVPLSPSDLRELAQSVASGLIATKEYRSAAIIYRDYLEDLSSAIDFFCQAHRFTEAIRLASLRGRPDLLAEIVDPGLADGFAHLTDVVADCKSQLAAQVSRLKELREKKAEDPLLFLEGVQSGMEGLDISDNVSIASTQASTAAGTFMTRYTGTLGGRTGQTGGTTASRKTSKNRRREERKRAKGKKGTIYEEEYLIGSLRRLADRVNQAVGEVGSLQEGMVRRGMRERARVIGVNMKELVEACDKAMGEVFETEDEKEKEEGKKGGINGEGNDEMGNAGMAMSAGERVLQESLKEMDKKQDRPVLKPFKTLVLVDY